MRCARPFVQGGAEFGCNQCMPCRINRRRLWTGRLMLEAHQHEFSLFVTLTYAPEFLPEGGNLVPKDMQDFLKRLRERVKPLLVRFYGVGEYGDATFRPHYHLALFGIRDAEHVHRSWKLGRVHVGTLTPESANYIVGYICKGMTRDSDPRLSGRHPEFCRMSLKPGIGAGAADAVAAAVLNRETGEYVGLVDGDVPSVFKWQGRNFPFGRYLRRKVRVKARLPEAAPKATGEIIAFRRAVDLRKHGLSGWKAREEKRVQSERIAKKKFEISNSRKGIVL